MAVNPTPSTQPLSPEVEKLSGKITVYTDGKKEVALELNVGKHFDTLKKWKNPATSEEFCVFIKLSDKILYITGRYDSKREASGDVVAINSVRIHGTETVYDVNNLKGMKNLVGLNKTTEIDVEISNVPFEVPEKTTEGTPTEKPEMTKESEADKPANVVDTGSTQGNPQPQPQPQPQGESKDETVTAGPEVAPESPTPTPTPTPAPAPAHAPAPTSLVTEGSPQPQGGTGTAETEPKSPVLVVNGEDSSPKAAESSTEQLAAAGGQFEDVIDTLEKQSEGEDVKGGQEHRLEIPEDKEDKTSLSGGEQEHEVLENHVEPQPKVSEDHKDGTGVKDSKNGNTPNSLVEETEEGRQQAPSNDKRR